MWILAIEQPGLLEVNPPSQLAWGTSSLTILFLVVIVAAYFGQDLLFAWRNWKLRRRAKAGLQHPEAAAQVELEEADSPREALSEVRESVNESHHIRVRPRERFRVDNRVNKPRMRGFGQR